MLSRFCCYNKVGSGRDRILRCPMRQSKAIELRARFSISSLAFCSCPSVRLSSCCPLSTIPDRFEFDLCDVFFGLSVCCHVLINTARCRSSFFPIFFLQRFVLLFLLFSSSLLPHSTPLTSSSPCSPLARSPPSPSAPSPPPRPR